VKSRTFFCAQTPRARVGALGGPGVEGGHRVMGHKEDLVAPGSCDSSFNRRVGSAVEWATQRPYAWQHACTLTTVWLDFVNVPECT
jgi:hypothetical protein